MPSVSFKYDYCGGYTESALGGLQETIARICRSRSGDGCSAGRYPWHWGWHAEALPLIVMLCV